MKLHVHIGRVHVHVHDDFMESEHPRVSSGEHAGEFTAKPGTGSGSAPQQSGVPNDMPKPESDRYGRIMGYSVTKNGSKSIFNEEGGLKYNTGWASTAKPEELSQVKALVKSATDLQSYVDTDAHYSVNAYLRGATEIPKGRLPISKEEVQQIISGIDHVMQQSILTKPMTLYRTSTLTNMDPSQVGKELNISTYLSTSTSRAAVKEFEDPTTWTIQIKVPAGTRGVDMNKTLGAAIESSSHQKEFLLDRGLRFRVVKVDPKTRAVSLEAI